MSQEQAAPDAGTDGAATYDIASVEAKWSGRASARSATR